MPVLEERGVTKARAKECPCEACKKGRGDPSKVAPMRMHNYSSVPEGGWIKQMTRNEEMGETPTLFMGVELETTIPSTPRDGISYERRLAQRQAVRAEVDRQYPFGPDFTGEMYTASTIGSYYPTETDEYRRWWRNRSQIEDSRFALEDRLLREGFGLPPEPKKREQFMPMRASADEAISFAEPVGFWHAKSDGSVTGPEFASLPGTLDYWYSIKPDLERMFTGLLHAGVRSHQGDKAGMHISISVQAFTDSDHLIRFSRLVNHNARWSHRMSQRTQESLHWSQLNHGPHRVGADAALERWARSVMQYGEASADRYNAINATCGGGRIEFRLPRGTLRIDRFYKNLEWVASMIEFTRDFASTGAATYMRWVMGQGERFTFLQGWLNEKYHLVPTDLYEPAPAPVNVRAQANMNGEVEIAPDNPYCSCGDGCYAGECQSCADPEPDDFYPDEEEMTYCPNCGQMHDFDLAQYQSATSAMISNATYHVHAYGDIIGNMRSYYRSDDGRWYEHVYNDDGNAIYEDGTLVPSIRQSFAIYTNNGQRYMPQQTSADPEEDARNEALESAIASLRSRIFTGIDQ